ncbi:hypothetical protein G6F57_016932 [Rhizopus arrhizus]|nr:hypothetical protein G6F57_016932 [Rhizopus arrhizus]
MLVLGAIQPHLRSLQDRPGHMTARTVSKHLRQNPDPKMTNCRYELDRKSSLTTIGGTRMDRCMVPITVRTVENMKILVVEDERKLAEYLKRALSEHNYVVDVASDGVSGLHLARETQYDLILLDVMLPGIDGFSVLNELRKSDRVPVLMLTARDKVEDRVRGLQDGADDYLHSADEEAKQSRNPAGKTC